MTQQHPWHTFDAERGLDVRRDSQGWQIRDRDGTTTRLSDAEFEQLRASGPNPKGLQ